MGMNFQVFTFFVYKIDTNSFRVRICWGPFRLAGLNKNLPLWEKNDLSAYRHPHFWLKSVLLAIRIDLLTDTIDNVKISSKNNIFSYFSFFHCKTPLTGCCISLSSPRIQGWTEASHKRHFPHCPFFSTLPPATLGKLCEKYMNLFFTYWALGNFGKTSKWVIPDQGLTSTRYPTLPGFFFYYSYPTRFFFENFRVQGSF